MAKRILSLFRNLFRKRALSRRWMMNSVQSLEILTQEKIEQGLSQATARREALIEIGGIEQVKEGVREVRAGHYVESFAGTSAMLCASFAAIRASQPSPS